MPGGRSPRRKGVNAEREVVNKLREFLVPASRIPLSGASAELPPGDVKVEVDVGKTWLGEVKRQEGLSKRFWDWLEGRKLLFMRRSQKPWLVVMTLEDFAGLVKAQQCLSENVTRVAESMEWIDLRPTEEPE